MSRFEIVAREDFSDVTYLLERSARAAHQALHYLRCDPREVEAEARQKQLSSYEKARKS